MTYAVKIFFCVGTPVIVAVIKVSSVSVDVPSIISPTEKFPNRVSSFTVISATCSVPII